MSSQLGIELNDSKAREQIVTDLNHNFLVEASAGSGKTSILVKRMVALIQSGRYSVHQIVAITFTRKAAIELKERFQQEIEETFFNTFKLQEKTLLQQALVNIEQCYLGTIHSFCARILREYTIEAGLDPGFKEMNEIDNNFYMERVWEQYLGSTRVQNISILKNLERLGIQVQDLKDCYKHACQYPETLLAHEEVSYPELNQAMDFLNSFCEEAVEYIPDQEPEQGYDQVQQAILLLRRLKNCNLFIEKDFNKIILLELLNKNYRTSGQIILNRWISKEKAKEYRDITFPQLKEKVIVPAVESWREYCYGDIIQFIQPAVEYYHSFCENHSLLNFQDLLLKTASLLRENPGIRLSIQKKYRSILVDEFQDTDPIQAEIFFYLAGHNIEEKDWKKMVPRAGSLFIVGDPQQSIYHFRRADITVYNQVKEMIQKNKGRIIRLNTNFRSLSSIGEYLNPLFGHLFSSQKGEFQAEYSPMQTIRKDKKGFLSGIYKIAITKEKNKLKTFENDARVITSLISSWVDQKVRILRSEEEMNQGKSPEVQYGDFMVLLRYKKGMDVYARIMAEYGIPTAVSGYSSINQSQNIRELLKLLRLLKDPENQVLLVAVLRGIFYGFSDDDLYQYKESGGEFNLFSDIPDILREDIKQKFTHAFEELRVYYSWCSQLLPVNVLEKIMTSSGLYPYACSEMDENNHANELYFILEYLKKIEMSDFYTYQGMVEKLEDLFKSGIEEEFGLMAEDNVVRIMNLHKAKGLEAAIVFLAIPYNTNSLDPKYYIDRLVDIPQGHFLVQKEHEYGKGKIIAQPKNWKEYYQIENSYLKAEETRLLYVAATRAKNLLIISGFVNDHSQAPWDSLLKDIQPEMLLNVPEITKIKKEKIDYSLRLYQKQEQKICDWNEYAMVSNYVEKIPSRMKRFEKEEAQSFSSVRDNGTDWGIAVHQILEYLVHEKPEKEILLSYIDYSFEKHHLPIDQKVRLIQLVQRFESSPLFYRIQNSLKKFVEVPFCLKIEPSDSLYQELAYDEANKGKTRNIIMKGIIDLVFQEKDGWVIVDYKTEYLKNDKNYQKMKQNYQKQIDIYAAIWENLNKKRIKEKIIYFV